VCRDDPDAPGHRAERGLTVFGAFAGSLLSAAKFAVNGMPVLSVTVRVFVPTFRTSTDCPTDTCVAGGNWSSKLAKVAVTSKMLLTGVVDGKLPLIGHASKVLTLIVMAE
jgi:hypothetical protein